MRSSSTLRRLAVAATVGGAVLAATPALASAASTCTYTPDPLRPRVDVFDGTGSGRLDIMRSGQFIAITDFPNTPKLCGGTGGFATVTNTDLIFVHGVTGTGFNGFNVNMVQGALAPGKTLETDGVSEIETSIDTNGGAMQLGVFGTPASETMRVSTAGGVMLGSDNDVDVRARSATHVSLQGAGGNDFLSGRGGFPATFPGPATTTVTMFGQQGDDTLVDGPLADDSLLGDEGNDTLFSNDSNPFDSDSGGADFDTATFDERDEVSGVERGRVVVVVGRLKLAPAVVTADAGKPARVKLAWKHPKAWKQLRSLKLRARDGGDVVGTVTIDPARGRISDRGAITATSRSKVAHHGKTVTARLELRASKKLAGRTLHLAVEATDARGRTQDEPLAGRLTIAR
jgi:hypothetical protein